MTQVSGCHQDRLEIENVPADTTEPYGTGKGQPTSSQHTSLIWVPKAKGRDYSSANAQPRIIMVPSSISQSDQRVVKGLGSPETTLLQWSSAGAVRNHHEGGEGAVGTINSHGRAFSLPQSVLLSGSIMPRPSKVTRKPYQLFNRWK